MRLIKLLSVFLLLAAVFPARFLTYAAEGVAASQGAEGAKEETAIVAEGKINVRGKPSLIGEVVTQLERGEKVTILERIATTPAKEGEPTNWAKIKLPPNTPVWVFAPFVKDGAVSVSRLNVRGGRGEAYSVLGRLNRGEEVKVIRQVEEWMEVEPPTNAYAFVDATLLQPEGAQTTATIQQPQVQPQRQPEQPSVAVQTPPTSTPPTAPGITQPETPAVAVTAPQTSVPIQLPGSNQPETPKAAPAAPTTNNTQNVATTPTQPEQPSNPTTEPPATPPEVSSPSAAVATVTQSPPAIEVPNSVTAPLDVSSATAPSTNQPSVAATAPTTSPLPTELPKVAPPVERKSEPAPKRIVRREGIVRATTSIQAPTWYELVNPETKKRVNYLFSDGMEINLKDYRGQKVVVSGEEGLDPRWPNTPILDMETLDVLPNESR
ncbi:MAG TPA: SH3 domain-containing protein [Verrucomicrobiae bacterium]